MYKGKKLAFIGKKYIVMVALMLIGIMGIFVGCGGNAGSDPYSNMIVKPSKSSVELSIALNGSGEIDAKNSKLTEQISVSVSKAPSAISTNVSVESLNPSVAKAEVVSGTRINITAVNGGKTQIKAMAGGGGNQGKYAIIEVVVNVPAAAMSQKENVHFGVARGGSIELKESSFDFSASTSLKSTGYTTTLNNVDYNFDNGSKSVSGGKIEGSMVIIDRTFPQAQSTVTLIPKINGNNSSAITVHIFNPIPMKDINVDGLGFNAVVKPADTTKSGIPTVELVKNAGVGTNADNAKVTFGNIDGYGTFNNNWGYKITSYDDNIVYINNAGNTGSFDIVSMGIGETDINVVIYPIKTINGVKVHFDKDGGLQVTQRIRVESRNVFKSSQLAFSQKDEELRDSVITQMDAFYKTGEIAENSFSLGVWETGVLSSLIINNTGEKPRNSYVKFQVEVNGSIMPRPWELFKITYRTWPYTGFAIPMLEADFSNGVPYNAMFAVSIRDATALGQLEGQTVVLKATSVMDSGVFSTIQVNCIRAIDSVKAEFQSRQVSTLYPVLDGTKNVDFSLITDVKSQSQFFGAVWEGSDGDIFEIVAPVDIDDCTSMFRLRIKAGANPAVASKYTFSMVYRDGTSIRLGIEILSTYAINNLVANVLATASEDVYNTKYTPSVLGGEMVAFVRVGKSYAINVNPSHLLAGYDITNEFGAPLVVEGMSFLENDWFRLANETNYVFWVKLRAHNSEVFGSDVRIKFQICAVNPIESATFSKNHVNVLASTTLGNSPVEGINATPVFSDLDDRASIVEFDLQLIFGEGEGNLENLKVSYSFDGMRIANVYSYQVSGGYAYNDVIKLWQYDVNDPTKFRLQGVMESGKIAIQFKIVQNYMIGDEKYEVDYFSGETNFFYVTVTESTVVENIYVTNAGASLDIMLDLNQLGTMVVPTHLLLQTSIYPYDANNQRLGFGFVIDTFNNSLMFSDIVQSVSGFGDTLINVDRISGRVTARQSNISPSRSIWLVVYSLDSLSGNDFPKTYIRLPVFVYNTLIGTNERVIRNLEEFLGAFYEMKPEATQQGYTTYLQAAQNGYLQSRSNLGNVVGGVNYNCHFQLAADINLSPVYIYGRYLPVIRDFGAGALSTAVFVGNKPNTLGEIETNYSILNFRVSPERIYRDSSGSLLSSPLQAPGHHIENYGFFEIIGVGGRVESVNFGTEKDGGRVTGNIHAENVGVASREQNVGVLAGVNRGLIKDVCVWISDSDSLVYSIGPNSSANVGGLVGRNEAGSRNNAFDTRGIEEGLGRLHVAGTIRVVFAVSQFPVNFGGIAGYNIGRIVGKDRNLLDEDVLVNSEMTLALVNGEDRNSWVHDAGKYINVGGVVGINTGLNACVTGLSSECAIYNSTKFNGNTGGVVGYNYGGAKLINSFSSSAIYARNAVGGVVGRNMGVTGVASENNTAIERCYYDNYLNERVKDMLMGLLKAHVRETLWGGEAFYSGIITDGSAMASYSQIGNSPTTIGGVVGINDSADVRFCFASSVFQNKTSSVFGLPYKGDIYVRNSLSVAVGGIIGRQDNTLVGVNSWVRESYSSLTIFFDDTNANASANYDMRFGGVIGYLNTVSGGGRANIVYCYSDIDMKVFWQSASMSANVSFGGLVGAVASGTNNAEFALCYSVNKAGNFIDASGVAITPSTRFQTRSGFIGYTDGTAPGGGISFGGAQIGRAHV